MGFDSRETDCNVTLVTNTQSTIAYRFLLKEVEQTASWANTSIQKAKYQSRPSDDQVPKEEINPYVQGLKVHRAIFIGLFVPPKAQ